MLPEVSGIHREFDYVVPERLIERARAAGTPVGVGTMVRVPLHGRQVAGWITELEPEVPEGVELFAVSKVSGAGPPPEIVELCRWAAERWVGRTSTMLRTASPPSMVDRLPRAAAAPPAELQARVGERVRSLFDRPVSLIRLPPAASPLEVIRGAVGLGNVLVVAPSAAAARVLADAMRREGIAVAVHPDGWARGAAGCSVVGARGSVFAPVTGLGAIVVVDEHDESLQHEGSPTWHAREVAVERARRAGVPCVLVSPTPTLEALAHVGGEVVTIDRARERDGWARLDIIDRREDDLARSGLYSERLVRALQSDRRVVCVLNRTGRARMWGCVKCGTLAACERCDAAVRSDDESVLRCPRCAFERPMVCAECGGTVLRPIRIGVTKAREQLEALLREPVDEITGARRPGAGSAAVRRPARVTVGTEAALQRLDRADVVAFLEFDQELGAPRYRAAEQALTLLARASRLVRGREGRVLVQTRQPEHAVLRAALLGDPTPVTEEERRRRELLGLPPVGTVAVVGGEAGPAFLAALEPLLAEGDPTAVVDQATPTDWFVRSRDRHALLAVLGSVARPPGRLRLQIDPARLPITTD